MRSVGDRGDPGVSGNEEYLFALDQGGGQRRRRKTWRKRRKRKR
jgi:hypothetical protein